MIHLNDERLARVRRSRDLNTPEWARLIQVCDQYLNTPLPYGAGHMISFALAGLIVNRDAYRQKAIALVMARCDLGYEAITHERTGYGHHGGVREIVPAVACVYDWLYPYLNSSQRIAMEQWLVNWANLCWPETQPANMRADYGRRDPGDNFYAGFIGASICAGVALTNHVGAAAMQGRPLLDIARRRWMAELFVHKAQFEPDGFPLEGSSYGVQAWSNLLLAMDAWHSQTGEDIWCDAPILLNRYLLHMTTPDMRRLTLWGDNAISQGGEGVNLMPLNSYVELPARIAINHVPETGSPTSFAWWLANINPMPPGGPNIQFEEQLPRGVRDNPGYISDQPEMSPSAFVAPSPFHWLAWAPPLFARPELRETGRGEVRPLVSPGNGFAIACGSAVGSIPPDHIERTATQLSFLCGPSLQAHQDKAQGAVQIYKDGEMLIGAAKLWNSHWTDWRAAENHSTLLLPPNQQVEPVWNDPDVPAGWKAAAASVRITKSEDKDGVLTIEGELAGAYAHRGPWHDDPEKRWVNPLKRWRRIIVWHRAKDLVVVIDEIVKEPWAQRPVIAWHVREFPTVFADGWRVDVNGYRVRGYTLSFGDITSATQVGQSWRVETKSPLSGPSVTALRVTRDGETFVDAVLYDQNGRLGATFGTGADAVTLSAQMSDAPPPPPKRRVYHFAARFGDEADNFDAEDWSLFALQLKTRLDRTTAAEQSYNVNAQLKDAPLEPRG